jgi:hypothetical protein
MVVAMDLEDIRAEPLPAHTPSRPAVTLQQSGQARSRRAAAQVDDQAAATATAAGEAEGGQWELT